MNDDSMESSEEFTLVESIFVRHRNCLLLRAQFTPVYVGYYLHLQEHSLRYPAVLDQTLKDLLAVLTLHLSARPRAETIAWTANLRAPRVNFFATGGSLDECVTGRLFTEDIREPDRNLLYSQTSVSGKEPRLTTVELGTNEPIEWIEYFYRQSEQRPARCFRLDDENFVLVAAQPDFDEAWLDGLDETRVSTVDEDEELIVLEERRFRFSCGCTLDRILPTLSSWKGQFAELFRGENRLVIRCPRCGATYFVTPDML